MFCPAKAVVCGYAVGLNISNSLAEGKTAWQSLSWNLISLGCYLEQDEVTAWPLKEKVHHCFAKMPAVANWDSWHCQESHTIAARDLYLTPCGTPACAPSEHWRSFALAVGFPHKLMNFSQKIRSKNSPKWFLVLGFFSVQSRKKKWWEFPSVSNSLNCLYHQVHEFNPLVWGKKVCLKHLPSPRDGLCTEPKQPQVCVDCQAQFHPGSKCRREKMLFLALAVRGLQIPWCALPAAWPTSLQLNGSAWKDAAVPATSPCLQITVESS